MAGLNEIILILLLAAKFNLPGEGAPAFIDISNHVVLENIRKKNVKETKAESFQ